MRQIQLDLVSQEMLESAVVSHPKAHVRQKSQMLLSSSRGMQVSAIAQSHAVGVRHVYRLFNAWESKGLLGLYVSTGRGAKSVLDWTNNAFFEQVEAEVAAHPQNLAKVAANLSLVTQKAVSKQMLKRNLKKKRYSWKRLRKTLKPLQNEAEYQAKLLELLHLTVLAKVGMISMFFADESYFNLSPEVPYGWQKRGEYVKIVPQRKTSQKIFGLLSRENQQLFTYEAKKNIDSDFVIACIEDFAAKTTQKTIIVLDNASTHVSKKVQARIEEWKEQDIELFYLPKYSPHLNLIETCWRKIKYEWLEPSDYDSQETLAAALKNIFDNYGTEFNINFSEFTNSKLLVNCN